ncbi:MAG: ADP-ribosylation factor-like protein [Candidatus Hodarchaeota archaeon]
MKESDLTPRAHVQYKIIICGAAGIGKTTLLHRHLEGNFLQNPKTTLGGKASVQEVRSKYDWDTEQGLGGIARVMEDETESFTYWDLGGQHIFSQLRPTYMTGANAIIIAFALNNRQSFFEAEESDQSIGQFLHELIRALGIDIKTIPTLLVGTKCDLEHKIQPQEVDYIARKLKKAGMNIVAYINNKFEGLQIYGNWSNKDVGDKKIMWDDSATKRWISTSSKTGENVSLAFEIIKKSLREIKRVKKMNTQWPRKSF